jgi:hypothetical protein
MDRTRRFPCQGGVAACQAGWRHESHHRRDHRAEHLQHDDDECHGADGRDRYSDGAGTDTSHHPPHDPRGGRDARHRRRDSGAGIGNNACLGHLLHWNPHASAARAILGVHGRGHGFSPARRRRIHTRGGVDTDRQHHPGTGRRRGWSSSTRYGSTAERRPWIRADPCSSSHSAIFSDTSFAPG